MPYPTIPSMKAYGNKFDIIASPIGQILSLTFHVNGKTYNFKNCWKHTVHKLPNQDAEFFVLYSSLYYLYLKKKKNVASSTYICTACLHAYIHIHFTDPIYVLRLFSMKQAMTTQQTMNIDKLKTY